MCEGRFSRFGRKRGIQSLALIFMVGTLGCVLSSSWVVLAIFWFILGLAVSGASAVVPRLPGRDRAIRDAGPDSHAQRVPESLRWLGGQGTERGGP